MRVVEADRVRAEETVEIDQLSPVDRIKYVRAVALLEIDHDLETIKQDVLLDAFQDAGRVVILVVNW